MKKEKKKKRRFQRMVGFIFRKKVVFCNQLNFVVFVTADSDGAGDISKDGDSDEGAEEQDAEERLNEAVEGDEKQAGCEEFVDKEHESQFCLETNFTNEEEEDTESTAEHEDSKGTKRVKSLEN